MTISIRTSNKRISRQVLHIVDALPLDTPYMRVQIGAERRQYMVCTWRELIHSLRNSYFKQLIRQTLPYAWIFNPLAFVLGVWRGTCALVDAVRREAKRKAPRTRISLEGGILGFRLGFVMFTLYTVGGIFQTISHFANIFHKAMGGSRTKPQNVLEGFWMGFCGFFRDTLITPWVALYTAPTTSLSRGDGFCKLLFITVVCLLRCAMCPLFGLLNFITSVTEGLANASIADFDQYAPIQERFEL